MQWQLYNLLLLNWYLLGVEMNLGPFRDVLENVRHAPRHFYRGVPPVHSSRFTMQRALCLRDRAVIYPGHTNRHPFLLEEGEILKVLYTSQHF